MTSTRPLAATFALAGGMALAAGAMMPAAATTTGEAEVAVTSPAGDAAAFVDGETTLELAGSGFQSVEGGFGGIYVAFGWVSGDGWGPSEGGVSGENYLYVADGMTAEENTGLMQFIAFPGSSTSAEAGGEMASDGTWSTTLVVPGPVLELSDAGGNTREVDCTVEQCGVLTFGAHGLRNANNETFSPIAFVVDDGAPVQESTSPEETPAVDPAEEDSVEETAPPAEDASGDAASDDAGDTGTEQGGGALPVIIAGAAAALIAVVVGVVVKLRRSSDQ